MLRSSIMLEWEMEKGGHCVELRENDYCGAVSTVCRAAVPSGAGRVLCREYEKAPWTCVRLLCSVLQLE